VGVIVEEDFKRWTAKRKAALVTVILQGKTSVSEAAGSFDLSPSEIEDWVDEGRKGLENALRAKPLSNTNGSSKSCRRRMERRCWSFAPEKSWNPCWAEKRSDSDRQAGIGS
jgi:transposase-like protein